MPGGEPRGGGSDQFEAWVQLAQAKYSGGHSRKREGSRTVGFLVTQESPAQFITSCAKRALITIFAAPQQTQARYRLSLPRRSFVERALCDEAFHVGNKELNR